MRQPTCWALTLSERASLVPLRARFFDGVHSQATPCWLCLVPVTPHAGVGIRLERVLPGPSADALYATLRTFSARQIEWPDAGTTRVALIRFEDGSQAQIGGDGDSDGAAALALALQAAGHRAPTLHAWGERMAGSWRWLLAGVAASVALSAAVWLYGVPLAASAVTRVMPLRWETALADKTLASLDATVLKPSALSADRQAQINNDFAALVATAWPGGTAPAYRLMFRGARSNLGGTGLSAGANALALPGGALVVTDPLVGLSDSAALMGVLAHELGHVQRRHAMRRVVEGSLLSAGVAVITGDITSVLATAPMLLASLSFSRAHEREADCYAVQTLRRAGVSAEPLARLLDTLAAASAGGSSVLSSHPSTPERIELLRNPALARATCG